MAGKPHKNRDLRFDTPRDSTPVESETSLDVAVSLPSVSDYAKLFEINKDDYWEGFNQFAVVTQRRPKTMEELVGAFRAVYFIGAARTAHRLKSSEGDELFGHFIDAAVAANKLESSGVDKLLTVSVAEFGRVVFRGREMYSILSKSQLPKKVAPSGGILDTPLRVHLEAGRDGLRNNRSGQIQNDVLKLDRGFEYRPEGSTGSFITVGGLCAVVEKIGRATMLDTIKGSLDVKKVIDDPLVQKDLAAYDALKEA